MEPDVMNDARVASQLVRNRPVRSIPHIHDPVARARRNEPPVDRPRALEERHVERVLVALEDLHTPVLRRKRARVPHPEPPVHRIRQQKASIMTELQSRNCV